MAPADLTITSPQNPRIKHAVRLRDRRHRDRAGELLIEGYRELRRALDHGHRPATVFFCEGFFLGGNEPMLLADAAAAGAQLVATNERVFRKLSYRDRPDGLVAIAPQVGRALAELPLGEPPFVVVAEAIEKPGNLGTILRSVDSAGADGLVLCDRTTDLNNPNVVRASVGTLFSVPVAEASGAAALDFLRQRGIAVVAATPAATADHWDTDLSGPVALLVGSEQYGLSDRWLAAADVQVRIPQRGSADSLNVATATTLLLYEVLRQRTAAGAVGDRSGR